MSILIFADHDEVQLKEGTYRAVMAAKKLGEEIHLLVMGDQVAEIAKQASYINGVSKVLLADHPQFKHLLAECVAPSIVKWASSYRYLIAPASTTVKNILPRVAAMLDVAMLSDVISIGSNQEFVRPIYAGNALATMSFTENTSIRILSVRATAFERAMLNTTQVVIESLHDIEIIQNSVKHISDELTITDRPELTSAKIIVSGGRGLKSAENFAKLSHLADCLGAAIGASRAAVDAGFAPNDYQIGQTGKMVAPDLYIAVGISGAIQHVAGMKDSKVIVAINNDPEAPIFELADYGLVGDLFAILPELENALCKVTS